MRYLCAVEVSTRNRNTSGADLSLTVRFSDDVATFGPVKIRVALSRAYINFLLENCELPLNPDFEGMWPISDESVNRSSTESSKTVRKKNNRAIKGTASVAPSASLKLASEVEVSGEYVVRSTTEVRTAWPHVSWRGHPAFPSLVFDSKPRQGFLAGTLLQNDVVGAFQPRTRFYGYALELEIPKTGLLIEDDNGFVSYPNKRGLIKIIAAQKLCRRPIRLFEGAILDE